MCHKIGIPPISTIGFGRTTVSSESRVPTPPAKITTFIARPAFIQDGHTGYRKFETCYNRPRQASFETGGAHQAPSADVYGHADRLTAASPAGRKLPRQYGALSRLLAA